MQIQVTKQLEIYISWITGDIEKVNWICTYLPNKGNDLDATF